MVRRLSMMESLAMANLLVADRTTANVPFKAKLISLTVINE